MKYQVEKVQDIRQLAEGTYLAAVEMNLTKSKAGRAMIAGKWTILDHPSTPGAAGRTITERYVVGFAPENGNPNEVDQTAFGLSIFVYNVCPALGVRTVGDIEEEVAAANGRQCKITIKHKDEKALDGTPRKTARITAYYQPSSPVVALGVAAKNNLQNLTQEKSYEFDMEEEGEESESENANEENESESANANTQSYYPKCTDGTLIPFGQADLYTRYLTALGAQDNREIAKLKKEVVKKGGRVN